MITEVKFVSIPVKDYDRALKFYTDKIDFKLVLDQRFVDGSRWIELQISESKTKVVLFTPHGQENRIGSFMNLSFTCDDIEKTYNEFKSKGVEFKVTPTKAPWGIYAQFLDSEGNKIIIQAEN